jgi:hypothetical protein
MRTPIRSPLQVALLALLAIGLAAPAHALAAQRFASPTGGNSEPCNPTPCDIVRAVNNASGTDEVIINPGTYTADGTPTGPPLTTTLGPVFGTMVVHGVAGQPRPLIFSSSASGGFEVDAGQLRYLQLQYSGVSEGLIVGGLADQLVVRSIAGSPCGLVAGGTLRDSVCWETGGAVAIDSGANVPGTFSSTLRNVTAFSSGGSAISARATSDANFTLAATNVIARGDPEDVFASSDPGTTATVNLDHSNYATRTTSGTGSSITDPTTNSNQTAAPSFVDLPNGDFHQLAGSPTVDAGANDPLNGPFDFEGSARQLGAATDIGADEFVPPSGSIGSGGSTQALAAVSGLSFSNTAFAADGSGPPATNAKRKKPPRGTRVSFLLNEAATVRFTVTRRARGRKVRRGKKTVCVKPTKRNRKRKACTRVITLKGSFSRNGVAGKNSFHFTGRLNGKKLKPRRYRLVATPTAGGKKGKPASRAFRIVR